MLLIMEFSNLSGNGIILAVGNVLVGSFLWKSPVDIFDKITSRFFESKVLIGVIGFTTWLDDPTKDKSFLLSFEILSGLKDLNLNLNIS